jgi:hypothetical protein
MSEQNNNNNQKVIEDTSNAIEQWKVKKLIQNLESARG